MGFDAQNFGLGLVVGWASAYGLYRARNVIGGTVTQFGKGAQRVQHSATRSADSRYINDLVEQCEYAHLAGRQVKLSEIVVEPRFLAPDVFAMPPDDEPYASPYKIVPNIPDHPYLQAPFSLETLSIEELASGSRALALVGLPGSGRTTALMTIALHGLGRVRFRATPDSVQQRLDSEESRLAEKERAVRVKERVLMEQRAKEQLANETGTTYEAHTERKPSKNKDDKAVDTPEVVPLFNRLMPVYVHFADLALTSGEINGSVDPAEPIVRAIQATVRRVTASTIPRNFYSRLTRGQVLLLLDGFDELLEAEQMAALDWLRAFLDLYKQNFVIVAAPAAGFARLTGVGLTPVYLRPWSDLDADALAARFKESWSRINKGRGRKNLNDEMLDRARANNRALSASEIVLKIWTGFADDADSVGVAGWYRAYLTRMLPKWEESQGALTQIAGLQIDEGFITAARLQSLGSTIEMAIDPTAGSLLQQGEDEGASGDTPIEAETSDKKDSETTSAQGRLLGVLRRAGLLVRYRGDRYRFRSSMLSSYLASLNLKNASLDALKDRTGKPAWNAAIAYAALVRPMDDLVKALSKNPPDLLTEPLLVMARWLAYAPQDVKWRGTVLNALGGQFVAPSQYPALRERTAAALIDSRDKNVLLVFRRAVRNMDADIRRLACLAMGALGDPEGLRDLKPLIDDRDPRVQLAAGMALGAVGTDEALQTMAVALTSGSEPLRQAMAEAFSALPEEGFPTLYDAVRDSDLMLRRAAIFGLRRIKSTWALIEIYRAFLEDEQWYVRSAAQQAFQEHQFGRSISMTLPYPPPDQIEWLKAWATERGETLPAGDAAGQMLLRALQEGDATVRVLAARALGQLMRVDMIKPLYNALRDGRDEVRTAAHRALADMQVQLGRALPSPV
ncbi:MAG: HEAT repeat domain-containing protein [Chloroflexota bacterium]|nr:HEAT repeat domain-containing protein [Chloroflexota bacterium]